jgi:hypothetical protein
MVSGIDLASSAFSLRQIGYGFQAAPSGFMRSSEKTSAFISARCKTTEI